MKLNKSALYTTEPAYRWKSHVTPSTDHEHHTWLETLRIRSSGSTVN